MYLQKTILLAFLVLTLSQCKKKDYPESVIQNEPEFYADLKTSNGSILLEAGPNNYRVYSSYVQDNTGMYKYISEFKTKGCTGTCANSLKFEINDSKISSFGAPADISAALFPGNFPYASSAWAVQFESGYNKPAATYRWRFGDGTESYDAAPNHIYKKGGAYNVCLTISSTGDCESTICNVIEVGYPSTNCTAYVESTSGASNSIQFYAHAIGQGPLVYHWDFGDGKTGSGAQPNHTYAVRGAYPVRVTVSDAKNDVAFWNYNAITLGDSSSCASNFKASSIVQTIDSLPFSKIVIRYTDANGEQYSSDQYAQDNDQKFEILSVEGYENNERGEPTKKLKIRFTANLYSGSKQIKFKDSEAVICISYKN